MRRTPHQSKESDPRWLARLSSAPASERSPSRCSRSVRRSPDDPEGVPRLDSRGSPDSSLLAVGLSHADAHVAVRESVYVNYVARPELRQLLAAAGEVVVLSTCNRTELYIATTDPQSAKAAATAALLARVGDGRAQADAARAVVTRCGFDVARHLFRVAAGLESVVPGETEILGQVQRRGWSRKKRAPPVRC